jgi:hypothetical protein
VQPLDVAAPRPALAFPVPNLSHEIPNTPKAPSSK